MNISMWMENCMPKLYTIEKCRHEHFHVDGTLYA